MAHDSSYTDQFQISFSRKQFAEYRGTNLKEFLRAGRPLPLEFSINRRKPDDMRPSILYTDENREVIEAAVSETKPVFLGEPAIFLFGKSILEVSEPDSEATQEELSLLLLEEIDQARQELDRRKTQRRAKYEWLSQKFSSGAAGRRREIIPEDVRIFVWRRDEGRCVQCGSNERLEFDHVIPLSRGGSSTERNLQLLCEFCNRSKSDKI